MQKMAADLPANELMTWTDNDRTQVQVQVLTAPLPLQQDICAAPLDQNHLMLLKYRKVKVWSRFLAVIGLGKLFVVWDIG